VKRKTYATPEEAKAARRDRAKIAARDRRKTPLHKTYEKTYRERTRKHRNTLEMKRYHKHAPKHRENMAGRSKPEFCEICGGTVGKQGIVFDHCHQRGHFRGWICRHCNVILGLCGDSVEHLLKLVAYLKRTEQNQGAQLNLAV